MKIGKNYWKYLVGLSTTFFFFYLFFIINPSLHHFNQQLGWHSNLNFLKYYFNFASGPGEYTSLFVTQLFSNNLLGSFIITFLTFLLGYFILKTASIKAGNNKLQILIIPVVQVVVLAVMSDYKFHFSILINLLVLAGLLYVYFKVKSKSLLLSTAQIIISGILLYCFSGGMYFNLFMLSALLLTLNSDIKDTVFRVIPILFLAFLVPFIAYKYFSVGSFKISFFRSIPDVAVMLRYGKPMLFYITLALIPFTFLFFKILQLFNFKTVNFTTVNFSKSFWAIVGISFIAFSFFIFRKSFNADDSFKIQIEQYAYQQNWEKVIELCEEADSYDRMVNFQYNRALAHNGQLLEKAFNYEQLLGSQALFLDKPFTGEVALPNSDIYFDLGNIDESQRYAFESQTLMPNSTRVIKRLTENALILGNNKAAGTFLNYLSSNPMEKKWVEKQRDFLKNESTASVGKLITKKRRYLSKAEGLFVTPRTKLISQLEENPLNKFAFEYLIAFDLMEHNLTDLLEDMKYMARLDYKTLPVVLEEAILLYQTQKRNMDYLNRVNVSANTKERFREFAKLTNANKGNLKKAKQATLEFKDTYWYYTLFLSPYVTNLKLDTKPVESNY